MSVTRRSFFKGGVISALLIGIPKGALAFADHLHTRTVRPGQKDAGTVSSSTDAFSLSTFAPHVNKKFSILRNGGTTLVTLTAVTDLRDQVRDHSAIQEGRECFSLEFKSSNGSELKAGIYTFNGPTGKFSMFISPMRPSKGASVYESVINHLQC
ncbi:MAG TPA: hypothetical protein VFC63_28880 [Blastocatellia bacterium]|nr:hypothetical protein [Blastocatellia bacterium]